MSLNINSRVLLQIASIFQTAIKWNQSGAQQEEHAGYLLATRPHAWKTAKATRTLDLLCQPQTYRNLIDDCIRFIFDGERVFVSI